MDINRNAIHLAQVEKVGAEFSLDARWTAFSNKITPQSDGGESSMSEYDPNHALEGMIEQAAKARSLFSQSNTAFTIGDGSIDYREFDIVVKEHSAIDEAVQKELESELGCDFESSLVKAWELPSSGRSYPHKQSTAVVCVDYGLTVWLGELVTRAGYTPEVLDAIPCALARAAEMFLADPQQSSLMVHLGDACTTLTLVQQGQPLVSRVLKHHGFENILVPLAEEFGILPIETFFLILKAANASCKISNHSSELLDILSQYQLRFVQSLASEVYRTLEYIRAEKCGENPAGIILCGNGSIMPKACLQFEQLLELPSETWSLPMRKGTGTTLPPSLYAIAAGLSAIAWES